MNTTTEADCRCGFTKGYDESNKLLIMTKTILYNEKNLESGAKKPLSSKASRGHTCAVSLWRKATEAAGGDNGMAPLRQKMTSFILLLRVRMWHVAGLNVR